MTTLLDIKQLHTSFQTEDGTIYGCDGVSYSVDKGETLAVVGESGSGKSVTAMSILQLIPSPPGRIESGQILFKGQDLIQASSDQIRSIRGNEIAMIFQEPMTSLNPVMTVGNQIAESMLLHQKIDRKKARRKALELLELVGISDPKARINNYPHQLSGGMRQRVMIAMALACRPDLLIADEPTSALDVTIQAQILALMKRLQKQIGMAIILITHDMGVVAETADKVAVMYCGQIVEYGTCEELFSSPKHPYLNGLQKSVLNIDQECAELDTIEGGVPDPLNLPKGCNFAPRCPHCLPVCKTEEPPATSFSVNHWTSCWLYTDQQEKEEKE